MATTKFNFWVAVIFVSLIFSYGILMFGQGLLNDPDIELSQSSQDYLSKYEYSLQSKGLEDAVMDPDFTENASNPLSGDSDTRNIFQDVFALWNKVVDILTAPIDFVVLVYKLPSFLLEGLGVDLQEWQFVSNILIWAMVVSIIVMAVRLAK